MPPPLESHSDRSPAWEGARSPRQALCLEANLRALASAAPALVRRLKLPVECDHVRTAADGRAQLAVGRGLVPLELGATAIDAALAGLPDPVLRNRGAFVFGVGTGELVTAALARSAGAPVTAWERDPWLLRSALARHDWAAELASGRLALRLGRDLLDELRAAPGGAPQRARRAPVVHPLLGELYAPERRVLARGVHDRPVVALALGELFVDDLAEALDALGFAVLPLELGRWSLEEIQESLAAAAASALVAVNYREGLAELCERARVPLACWEIDPTTDRDVRLAAAASTARVFTWRRRNVALYREAGFEHAAHLPLAANVARHRPLGPDELTPEERAHYAAPVAFVGASLVARGNELRQRFVALHTALVPAVPMPRLERAIDDVLEHQRRAGADYVLPALVGERFADLIAALRRHDVRDDPVLLLAETAAAERRCSVASGLAREGLAVWGDAGWAPLARAGLEYRGPAGHRRELVKIYNAASVHVDIGRLYQRDIVTMRVFDVLACGGFAIAEHSEDLERLFDVGVELESWRTPDELAAKVAHYRAHPAAARAIALHGREAVRERHAIAQRVATMLAAIGVSASSPPARPARPSSAA